MKRYNSYKDSSGELVMVEAENGEWVKFSDVPKMDKPAALMALVGYYAQFNPREGTADAIHKLAAAIIAATEGK